MKGSSLSDQFKAHDRDVTDAQAPILKNTKAVLMLVIGKKRTGKSTLVLNMLNSKKLYGDYFQNIFLISPSTSDDKMKPLINELEKEDKFYKELTESNIEKIKNYITDEQARIRLYDKRNKTKTPMPRNLLILDDVVTDLPRSFKKNVITGLFYNMRHYSLSIFLISQSYKQIFPSIRKQADMIYTFPMTNLKEKEALQDDWDVPDYIFDKAFQREEDHPFLTINISGSKPVFFRMMDRIE